MKITDEILVRMHKAAIDAYKNAYAPYSSFPVAAAVLSKGKRIFAGVNIENASYGLTRCAEQIAVGNAITNGCHELCAVLVFTEKGDSWPCGACRQILAEFNLDMPVYIADKNEIKDKKLVRELLPWDFSCDNLVGS
ncbi:MAG: cytidine deaminase [Candidatus Zixiibacteriota bacterium]